MTELRPELPEPPARIARLPVSRGYPVPWFVAWVDDAGSPTQAGEGTPDFRVLMPGAVSIARIYGRCWICGVPLGVNVAFVVGPMCVINRTSAEPASHVDCANWAAVACPFLTRPDMSRRETGLPEGVADPPGIMLRRNPGVAVVWETRRSRVRAFPDGRGGTLFNIGAPENVRWYAEGRPATRAEAEESIDSGFPALREIAEKEGERALRHLDSYAAAARGLLPA